MAQPESINWSMVSLACRWLQSSRSATARRPKRDPSHQRLSTLLASFVSYLPTVFGLGRRFSVLSSRFLLDVGEPAAVLDVDLPKRRWPSNRAPSSTFIRSVWIIPLDPASLPQLHAPRANDAPHDGARNHDFGRFDIAINPSALAHDDRTRRLHGASDLALNADRPFAFDSAEYFHVRADDRDILVRLTTKCSSSLVAHSLSRPFSREAQVRSTASRRRQETPIHRPMDETTLTRGRQGVDRFPRSRPSFGPANRRCGAKRRQSVAEALADEHLPAAEAPSLARISQA